MSKRLLTGGTGDVNPQAFAFTVATTTANTYREAEVTLPVNQVGTGTRNRAQVVELLKLFVEYPTNEVVAQDGCFLQLSTAPVGAFTSIGDPSVIFSGGNVWLLATEGAVLQNNPYEYDFTDGAGHGVLIGTNSLIAGVTSAGMAGLVSFGVRILYRLKNVSITEYVGIVQSQQ